MITKEIKIVQLEDLNYKEELLKDMLKSLINKMNLLQVLEIIDVQVEEHFNINDLSKQPKQKVTIIIKK